MHPKSEPRDENESAPSRGLRSPPSGGHYSGVVNVPFLELKPTYDELRAEVDAAYRRVMDSGWYIFGPEITAFEGEYAASVGVHHAIAVANGLEALQLVLMAARVGPGDEVIVPSHTYIATWLAVTHVGATIVPCEPDERTWNIDPKRVASLITPRTRCILPVHLYGQTADVAALRALADPRDILVLEDAAQSQGATAHGIASGALGHAAGVSFYPSKNLGAFGDAGAVTTSDPALADRVRTLRNYGSRERYHHEMPGLNSRLSELQCAFLRAKLPRLNTWNARRRAFAAIYRERLAAVPDLVLPEIAPWADPVWHLFVVRTSRREALRAFLAARGIATQIHYPIPPHRSGAYASLGWKPGAFPLAERLAEEVLSLPIGPHHREDQIHAVCDAVRAFYGV